MRESRPEFREIASFEEFEKYYWYREELSKICKELNIEYRGTKQELNTNIKAYFSGEVAHGKPMKKNNRALEKITEDSSLLECGFSFNARFREYFSLITGVSPFKFTADMGAAWRKVKREQDTSFTIKDMLNVYHGKSDYATYDRAVCQWNQFLKDFCTDEKSLAYTNKLKVAAILWTEVKNSTKEKIYTRELLDIYFDKIRVYRK